MSQTHREIPASKGAGGDTAALDTLATAVESGAGLPEVARAASAALGAGVALIDAKHAVLAVAANSPSEERDLLSNESEVTAIDLRVAESNVGQLRIRARGGVPEPLVLR